LYPEKVTIVWIQIFELLIYSFIPVASVYIFGTLMTANASLKQLNIIAISGVILNIVLNYLLIPKMQAYGATLATLITQSLVAIVHIIWARKIFKLRFSKAFLFQIVSFIISILLINFLITNYLQIENWFIKFVFATSLTVLMAFITKLIDLKAFLALLKSRA
jgi:O-antigen/teichoic acid export membrane protein